MKKLICLASVFAVAASAQAGWLLWTVTEADAAASGIEGVAGMQIGYVQTGVVPEWGKGTIFQVNWNLDHTSSEGPQLALTENEQQATMVDISSIGSIENYSFYVELLNSAGDVIGRTAKGDGNTYAPYSTLKDVYVAGDIGDVPSANVWHGGSFEAVPEPSSMALLALGAGLVGLRRKLRKGKKGKRA